MKKLTASTVLLWMLYFMVRFTKVKSGTEIPVGFPCENIPNFCDRVNCAGPLNCQNGMVVKGAGNCGCCEACITYRDVGESCTGAAVMPVQLPKGVIAQYFEYDTCMPGLQCNSQKICEVFTSDATGSPGFKECIYHESEYSENEWEGKPSCDFYGDYASKSCKGRNNPRCFCVDENGSTIFGRLPEGSDNATCACSRAVHDFLESPLSDFIRCDETGDFMPLQCWDSICFCVDPYTKNMVSAAVPIAGIQALPCWDKTLYNVTYYTPCKSEFLKQSGIVEEQFLKGMTINPLDLPNCDPDGTYGFKQYQGNAYFCSDRTGGQIASYVVTEYVNYQEMICNCARDSYYPNGLPDNGRSFKCDNIGNYKNTYCIQDVCFCLDSDGQQCSDTYNYDDPKFVCPTTPGSRMLGWTHNVWTEQKP